MEEANERLLRRLGEMRSAAAARGETVPVFEESIDRVKRLRAGGAETEAAGLYEPTEEVKLVAAEMANSFYQQRMETAPRESTGEMLLAVDMKELEWIVAGLRQIRNIAGDPIVDAMVDQFIGLRASVADGEAAL